MAKVSDALKTILFGLLFSIGKGNEAQLLCIKLLQDPNSPPFLVQYCLNLSSRVPDPTKSPVVPVVPRSLQNCTRLPPRPAQTTSSDWVDGKPDLQTLLKQGVDTILLPEHVKEALLILGNTGCGKTTITQLIAGNTSRLHSVLSFSNKTIIIDDDGRIGAPSTKSKTLFPELVFQVHENSTSTAIYDCPGFDDSRGAEVDIAANYFIKMVTDHLTSVKLLFLVTYSSVKIGNERLDFDRMASHAVKFMKNIAKFQQNGGFGLIVTKVNSYELGEYLSDDTILAEIVEFLTTYQETLRENLQNGDMTPEEESLEGNKLQFVDTLLQNSAKNIWFSRSPDRCGPLSSIPSVMDSRSKIIEFQQNLNYTPTTQSDFGYSLKAKTLLRVKTFTSEINQKIKNATMELAQNFKTMLSKTMRKKRDIFTKENSIQLDYLKMKRLMQDLSSENVSYHPELVVTAVTESMNDLNYYDPHYEKRMLLKEELKRQGNFLNFFERVTEARVQRDVAEWISPFKDFVEDPLKNVGDWYNFLTNVYSTISSYSFQQGRRVSMTTKIYSIHELPSIGIPVPNYILQLLNNSTSTNRIKPKDLVLLQELVNFGVKPPEIVCSGNRMTVRGHFVKVKDFVDAVTGLLVCEITTQEVQFLEVFATHTLFLDMDIIAPREMQVSILAPKWEIVSKRRINLDGHRAPRHFQSRASDGPLYSSDGSDGAPGHPGGNGGTFFGVGDVFVNLGNLSISANGGDGGDGQDGGNGAIGYKGLSSGGKGGCWTPTNIFPIFGTWSVQNSGGSGGRGGRGGDGGVAGSAGSSGKILFIQTSQKGQGQGQPFQDPKAGKGGEVGKGGQGGQGGQHGDTLTCDEQHVWILCKTGYCSYTPIHIWAEDGKNGVDGNNAKHQPQAPIRLQTQPEYKTMNDFKLFYTVHHPPSFLVLGDSSFISRLNQDETINDHYSPIAFGEELLNLVSLSASNSMSHQEQWPAFLNRLDAHVQKKRPQLTPQDKQFLSILYATAISKLITLTQEPNPTMVINVQGYLDVVLDRIQNLKRIQTQVAILQRREELQAEFKKKMETSLKFIQKSIMPGIQGVEKELDEAVNGLLQQIIRLQTEETNQEYRERNQKTMDSVGVLRRVFSLLKLIGKVLGVLGPEGILIGETIRTAATIFGPIILPIEKQNVEEPNPVSRTLADNFNNENEDLDKMKLIFEQIAKIIRGNDKLSKTFTPALSAFNETILGVENRSMGSNQPIQGISDSRELETSKNNFGQFLNSMETEYQSANDTGAVKVVQKLQNIFRVAELGMQIYNQIKTDEPALKEVGTLVAVSEGKTKELEVFKESIYQILIPMMARFSTNVGNITQNLASETATPVGTLVAKWKIKEELRNLKFQLKKHTQGLSLQENFVHLIEKLEEGLILMMDVYDAIAKYREGQRLSQFMIGSTSSMETPLQDPNMLKISSALKKAVESDIFFAEYKKALHAFKQWVFPFAHNYRHQLLPVTHTNNVFNDSSLLIDLYTKQVKNLQLRLKHYGATSDGSQDTHLLRSSFYSNLRSSGPFFTWTNEKWANSIRDILAGVKTQVMADIQSFPPPNMDGKGAVKFSLIELNFRVRDGEEGEQEVLDEKLKDFGVTMTHSGISRYKFQEEYFVMIGDNQTLRYNFERGPHGGRTGTNLVYEKFKSGDFLLSPYALWTIQLSKINGGGNYSFHDLQKYSSLVDMELVGNGTYVDEGAFELKGQDLKIEEYYEIEQFDK